MTVYYPSMNSAFQVEDDTVGCIVVENKQVLVNMISDMYWQTEGVKGKTVISVGGTIIDFQKNVELLTNYFPFEVNKKSLIAKLLNRLEIEACAPEHCEETSKLVAFIEQYLDSLSEDFPCGLRYKKLSMQSILKAIGCEIEDNDKSLSERILAYMDLVREFEADKVFILVNYRSFVSDIDAERFMESILLRKHKLILIESVDYKRIKYETRLTIDDDLCIF